MKLIKIKKILSYFLIPLILTVILFIQPEINEASSGGRIGGGDFSAPSAPLNRGYGGSSGMSYGDYNGSYRRGNIGFPFVIPIFGFGGGGIFGFLILIAISGIITNAFRGGSRSLTNTDNLINNVRSSNSPITIIQLQMGLLASAKSLQEDLRKLANTGDTSSKAGLQDILQETTLSLLRQPELWVYAHIESGKVPFSSAESTFNRLSLTERSKLKSEITSNFSGKINSSISAKNLCGEADPTNEFIAITILLASRNQPIIDQSINNENLRENLKILGSISSTDLIALEVIWQPEGAGDSLSKNELVTTYSNLKYL